MALKVQFDFKDINGLLEEIVALLQDAKDTYDNDERERLVEDCIGLVADLKPKIEALEKIKKSTIHDN